MKARCLGFSVLPPLVSEAVFRGEMAGFRLADSGRILIERDLPKSKMAERFGDLGAGTNGLDSSASHV